ncbi:ectonucleoside triphosphate diphosphohydrolase 5 [Fopius arisanus]|uniref:Ectonucleoside triphosphate diphosphohydrolase 5 n=1 Tax=Fopius arisanus TaxID=64838 RepID=A0A9R1U080_9HYME|nr:PREDICTED: ectonucleoside triphosphate diphosphohydrolase 5 [Fopius arisanus]
MQYIPLQTDDESSPELASRPKKMSRQSNRRSIIFLFILGILLLGYLAIANDLRTTRIGSSAIDSIASSLKLQKYNYIVVIDAGSTGTRILVFTFHSSIINGDLVLDNEFFEETKPGLSSYVDNSKKMIESLGRLVEKAKAVIPQDLWSQTPLNLKATAGLRLLPEVQANYLLDECRNFLKNSGFFIAEAAVSLMGGADEGIYGWFTVNFLLNRLSSHNIGNTVAVLDLGGASTQVTYVPDQDDFKELAGHIYTINTFSHNLSLYTHSYLGMGVMAARRAILTLEMSDEDNQNPNERIEIRSECINPIISNEWSYGGRNYMVRGPVNGSYQIVKTQNYAGADEKRPIVRAEDCKNLVKRFIDGVGVRPLGLKKHEIYGVSYYFDRATEAGLIDPFKGGVITLDTFYNGTIDACNYPNADQPYTCLDMMYIYVLLKECFALEGSTKLNLHRRWEGHEMSWALGAAVSIYQDL